MIHSMLWVGARSLPEFARIASNLKSRYPIQFIDQLSDVDFNTAVDFIVLAQTRPGLIAENTVAVIRQRWPGVRLVSLLGNWCEGEARTGTPLPDVPRIYAHQWSEEGWFLEGLVRGSSLPRSHSGSGPLVVIQTSSTDYSSALADALALAGCQTVEVRPAVSPRIQNAEYVIWDVPIEAGRRGEELAELRKQHARARVIALCTFPRDYEIRALLAAGVDQVISQPFAQERLIHAVYQPSEPTAFSSAA
jgi:CheY-like chemotaxis protein